MPRHINVIAPPTESELEQQQQNPQNQNHLKPSIVDGKKYCPYDSRLLVFKGDLDSAYCGDCGYTENPQASPKVQQGASISSESDTQAQNTDNIGMDLIPIGANKNRRSIQQREQELSSDPDTRRLQEKGYIIIEQNITVNEIGTYNVEEMRERQQKRSVVRNRFNSSSNYSVY